MTARAANGPAGRGDGLARAGAIWGTVAGLGLGAVRVLNEDLPLHAALPGQAAFLVAYLAPFVLALVAGRLVPARRIPVWVATGVLGLLLSITSAAGVTLVLVPAGVLLLAGAARASRDEARGPSWRGLAWVLGLVAAGVLAWSTPFLERDPRCFALERTAGGGEVWREIPPTDTLVGGPGVVEMVCTSDTTSPREASLSLGAWAAAAVVLLGGRRSREIRVPTPTTA